MNQKTKELERRNHENESVIYKNNEVIMNLTRTLQIKEEELSKETTEKNDHYEKLKTLINEVRIILYWDL